MMTDPIADMLTRIRNGQRARHAEARIPSSKLKVAVARVLEASGYIRGIEVEAGEGKPTLTVGLRYRDDGREMIDGVQRVSRPSRRVYVGAEEIPKVRNGIGMAIISTSKGLMTDEDARAQKLGGEVLCEVW
ncbi:MAG: 30S ribosomal protein S8 [Deltaproteobacteria bacterium]|nr:30S ribosomal protein S8 [Deltaproteobacteria bacterium]MBW2446434.1 30S ribosomal protein S8 [Deltaproteobacteria bacterium]